MRSRFGQMLRVEIALTDEQHVGIIPRPRMRIERPARCAVVVRQHPRPMGRDIVAGAGAIAIILAPGAHIGATPHAEREQIVIVRVMTGKRLVDLAEQSLHRRNIRAGDRRLVDEGREHAILAGLHRCAALAKGPDAASVHFDEIETPIGKEESNILIDMAVKADLAFSDRSFGQLGFAGRIGLRTAIAAKVRINACLEPHGMELVGQGTERRVALARAQGRWEFLRTDQQFSIIRPALEPPTIVDIDILIALRGETAVDDPLRRSE